jgi:hypothetical protein
MKGTRVPQEGAIGAGVDEARVRDGPASAPLMGRTATACAWLWGWMELFTGPNQT